MLVALRRITNKIKKINEILDHPSNRNRRLAGIFRYLQCNIGRRLLTEAHYAIEIVPNAIVILSNRENYATLAYTCRLYDFQEMQFLLHFLRSGDVFGDFGANVGIYSVLAGSIGSTVLAVEPVPATYARLRQNLRLNSVAGKAVLCGLSDCSGSLQFTSQLGGMNRVATIRDVDTIEVEVRTADSLAATTQLQPLVLKIDVEDFELPLLRGASTLLKEVVAIIIELNGSGEMYRRSDIEVHEFLVQAGFAPDTRELERRSTYRQHSFNSLYIRREQINAVKERVSHVGLQTRDA